MTSGSDAKEDAVGNGNGIGNGAGFSEAEGAESSMERISDADVETDALQGTPRSMTDHMHVPRANKILFWVLVVGGLALDLGSKAWIFSWVGEPPSMPVPLIAPVVELRTSYNPGALWGFGNSWEYSSLVFAGLSLVAALVIWFILFQKQGASDRLLTVALGLIMAGALGNCYDRVVHGQVRDFVHVHVDAIGFDWPIFNFADNLLVAGSLILVYMSLRPEADFEVAPTDQ